MWCLFRTFSKLREVTFLENVTHSYVLAIPFWMGDSRFEGTAPVLPIVAEIFRFEMILAKMSDHYEFCKSIKPFTSSLRNSLLLTMRCVRFCQLPSSSWVFFDPCQQKCELFWHSWKKHRERVVESTQSVIFKPWKVQWNWIGYCTSCK